ncbi:MAG: hypothetical protein ISS55_02535 [Dehalococcoidales bacterium]|nr:hypothetical protein [Dehalococcoidales bacterium]
MERTLTEIRAMEEIPLLEFDSSTSPEALARKCRRRGNDRPSCSPSRVWLRPWVVKCADYGFPALRRRSS